MPLQGLSDEHQKMVDDIKRFIHDEMLRHEVAFHDLEAERVFYAGQTPKSTADIVKEHDKIVLEIGEIADKFLGTRMSPLMGGGRADDGVLSIVDINKKNLNSVMRDLKFLKDKAEQETVTKLKLPASVWVALITTIGLIAVAVIDGLIK